jgi:hypothetical protein
MQAVENALMHGSENVRPLMQVTQACDRIAMSFEQIGGGPASPSPHTAPHVAPAVQAQSLMMASSWNFVPTGSAAWQQFKHVIWLAHAVQSAPLPHGSPPDEELDVAEPPPKPPLEVALKLPPKPPLEVALKPPPEVALKLPLEAPPFVLDDPGPDVELLELDDVTVDELPPAPPLHAPLRSSQTITSELQATADAAHPSAPQATTSRPA